MRFQIEIEPSGVFHLASARVPRKGMFVRVRPFSALGRSPEEAVDLVKRQVEFEFRRIPSPVCQE